MSSHSPHGLAVALLLLLPSGLRAQDSASAAITAEPSSSTDAAATRLLAPEAPAKPRKKSLFRKVVDVASSKEVRSVAKTALCYGVPGGQLAAEGISAAEAAAGEQSGGSCLGVGAAAGAAAHDLADGATGGGASDAATVDPSSPVVQESQVAYLEAQARGVKRKDLERAYKRITGNNPRNTSEEYRALTAAYRALPGDPGQVNSKEAAQARMALEVMGNPPTAGSVDGSMAQAMAQAGAGAAGGREGVAETGTIELEVPTDPAGALRAGRLVITGFVIPIEPDAQRAYAMQLQQHPQLRSLAAPLAEVGGTWRLEAFVPADMGGKSMAGNLLETVQGAIALGGYEGSLGHGAHSGTPPRVEVVRVK